MIEKHYNILNMSQEEMNKIPDYEFSNLNPFLKRSCSDCSSLIGFMTLECSNYEAKKARGTKLPTCVKCQFWKPNKKQIAAITNTNLSSVVCPDGVYFNLIN